tara:strand:+ start:1235 stop:1771 length:537 start_codon:yes stop_codon:yes gene_type:complete
MASKAVDLYVIYQIIKRISTPFEDTDAYKLGLIDAKGKKLKKASSREEKDAITYFDRFVFNIKRVMAKVGLDTKVGSYAAALFLLKESERKGEPTESEILEGILVEFDYLCENTSMSYGDLFLEDAPAVATGAAVAGTGDDPVHWKRRGRPRQKGKAIDATAFLKRMNIKYLPPKDKA